MYTNITYVQVYFAFNIDKEGYFKFASVKYDKNCCICSTDKTLV